MKKLFLLISLIIYSILTSKIYSQSQFSGWMATFNNFKTGKKTSIHNDIQWRSTDHIKHMQSFLFRTGLNVHLKKNLVATAGYGFISNRRTVGTVHGYAPEHRVWEQLLVSHKIKSVSMSHRFRVEQRFISQSRVVNNELEHSGYNYANRFRYFFRNILPLKKQDQFQKGVYAALQNEVFLNFGNTSKVNGKIFDQNRFYIATGYRLGVKTDIEVGYMNQYIDGRGGSFTNNHVMQLASYFRL